MPFNVQPDTPYLVHLGVANYLGTSAYYSCLVKLRSSIEFLDNFTFRTVSPSPTLYQYRAFVEDEQSWETPLTFQINNVTFSGNTSTIQRVTINGVELTVNESSSWHPTYPGYYYDVLVELWIFDVETESFQFHDRIVSFRLNLTAPPSM